MAAKCKHDGGRWVWDCACSYGPPSCASCHLKSECMKCKKYTTLQPTVKFSRPYDWTARKYEDEK